MAKYYTTDLEGITRLEPSRSEQRELISELMRDGLAAGDVWLAHTASGWSLSVFPSGLVQLERPGKTLRELGPLRLPQILNLWGLLAQGELATLDREPWRIASIR